MTTAAENFVLIQTLQRHPWFAASFAFGATMSAFTIVLLLFPGTALDSFWRLNLDAHLAFQSIGAWSIMLMALVAAACFLAAIGLSLGAPWGARLALIILSVNIAGDSINAVFRHDYRSLIGLPIGAGMILYLIRSKPRPQPVAPEQKAWKPGHSP